VNVHLTGMGLIGSTLAWELERLGVDWTWDDSDTRLNAWHASTGCVYPDAEPVAAEGYAEWLSAVDGLKRMPGYWVSGQPLVERTAFWYNSKVAPHDIRDAPAADLEWARLSQHPSFSLNVPRFVINARVEFGHRRLSSAAHSDKSSLFVVSHGFSDRLDHYSWGWSARARLSIPTGLIDASPYRPCLAFRNGRYQNCYAYPIPGSDEHFIGSSMISQTVPRTLEIPGKASTWTRAMAEVTGGRVKVLGAKNFANGWRPYPLAAPDRSSLFDAGPTGELRVAPLRHSGVRLSRLVAVVFCEILAERKIIKKGKRK